MVARSLPLDFEPRAVCPDCRRPVSVCYCRHVTKVPTKTRVVVLQHPRERDMPIGTARMATLCLPNAELHEGVRWDDAALARVLADEARPAILLYPGAGARDVLKDPPRGPVTLVAIDGTWAQAKKLVRENPRLQALPRYAFAPPAPSEYRIRREPKDTYVSTIEALVHVLGALEGDPAPFQALLQPFRAMIDAQIACERALRGAGARHAKKSSWVRKPKVHPLLADPGVDVVCVSGEANAWPYRQREPGVDYRDELVHWAAQRLSTGETLSRVLAPVGPVAPRTPSYIGLAEAAVRGGGTPVELADAWRGFVKETDLVCFWGHYATSLFVRSIGGAWPALRLDLRTVSRDFAKAKVGSLEDHVERLGLAIDAPRIEGRAGRRVAEVVALVEHFRRLGIAERAAVQAGEPRSDRDEA
jgi:DTW domain-containing protein YfiP